MNVFSSLAIFLISFYPNANFQCQVPNATASSPMILPIHSAATGTLAIARACKNMGFNELAIHNLNRFDWLWNTLMQDTMWLQNARNADAPADGCAPEDLWKCEGAEGHRQGWEDAAAREEEGTIWGNYFIIHFKWCRKNYFHKNQRFDLCDLFVFKCKT